MSKNQKKVITIAVPIDIDDAYLEKIKGMLENYKSTPNSINPSSLRSHHEEIFASEKELREFMAQAGFSDYKIPKHDMGIYYDKGLTIKKTDNTFEVRISA
ncbi:hypothetical protein OAP11_06210 [Bacteroidia bacterium]|nr:hypothetical protein [Bacteroidia bacterium]